MVTMEEAIYNPLGSTHNLMPHLKAREITLYSTLPTHGSRPDVVRTSIPKPRTSIERGSALNSLVTASAIFKPTANQQPAVGSAVRPAVPAASKLPVKGLPTSLGSLSVGSHENNGATGKGVIFGVVSLTLLT
ncbi:putative microtubule-associated tumor suppressor candidate 2 -like [Scophthalmus maximus]|uniref:Putative microtubule-associated tumor suppressor candidate 2-like n=1 Tax=Scophthalmus maximus TaxID=52904 RepID=A0A2U9BPX7_SCOMX|nr:putative microtubule-associated tumor suppressor candidate 2 -like [Scophthalmus maximus]